MIYRWSILETLPHDTRERQDQGAYYKKICLSYKLQFTDVLSNKRILLPSMIRAKFLRPLWSCMAVHTGLVTIFYNSNAQVLHVSAKLPVTRKEFPDFPQYPHANFWTVTSGRTSFNFFFVVYPPHTIVFPSHFTQYIRMAATEIIPAGMGVSGAVREGIYLTLWRRNYFLILAHSVYKMWIIQEPNKLALWNKLHFEEKKTESIEHV